MLSVMIGVVAALVIVAAIVMVVLKIQHSNVDERSKSHVEGHGKTTKTAPIQRELRYREGGSLIIDEKHLGSPFRKLDSSGEISESDEKNPDIIPQQITGKISAAIQETQFFERLGCQGAVSSRLPYMLILVFRDELNKEICWL